MRGRKLTATLAATALIGAGAVALPAASGADAPASSAAMAKTGKTYRVKVLDDYYSPIDLKAKVGDKVKWKWGADNGNPHNVTLEKGPKGVKKKDFTSATGSVGIKFNWKFTKAGTYDYLCTIHATVMTGTVKVKR